MLKGILMILGMLAVGLLVWKLLDRQGFGSPPTDDSPEQ